MTRKKGVALAQALKPPAPSGAPRALEIAFSQCPACTRLLSVIGIGRSVVETGLAVSTIPVTEHMALRKMGTLLLPENLHWTRATCRCVQ